jgi:hypothetical protein
MMYNPGCPEDEMKNGTKKATSVDVAFCQKKQTVSDWISSPVKS